jgi:hypothetical protein
MKYVLGWTWLNTEHNDIAANDDFKITDAAGTILVEKRAVAAGDDLAFFFPKAIPFNGLTVAELDGGLCLIYLE